jgi:hypothetical protein
MSHQNKIFYYMEVKLPNHTGTDIIGGMKNLLAEHIAATGSKKSMIAGETTFSSVVLHNVVGDVQAVTLEFINERNYDTYIQATSEFRTWVEANYNAEYVFEKVSATSYSAMTAGKTDSENGGIETYYEGIKKYMIVDLPTSRGFK